MARKNVKNKKVTKSVVSPFKNYWSKENYYFLAVGILVLLVGFFLMAQSPWNNPISLSVSPVILLFGYFVVLPLAILYKKKNTSKKDVSGKS